MGGVSSPFSPFPSPLLLFACGPFRYARCCELRASFGLAMELQGACLGHWFCCLFCSFCCSSRSVIHPFFFLPSPLTRQHPWHPVCTT